MFCRECGQQLNDDAKFCPKCGANVVGNGSSGLENHVSFEDTFPDDEKINWKEFLTFENIEKFGSIVAFLPLVTFVVGILLMGVLFRILGGVPIISGILRGISFLLKFLFVLVGVAASVGLVYIAIKKKDILKVATWIVPGTVIIAAIATILFVFGMLPLAFVLGLITAVLGLEFFARIVIDGQPMDSAMNLGNVFSTYKNYYTDYRTKNPTSKELERMGYVDPENSKFDGLGLQLLGYTVLAIVVCTITCGLAAPWMICKIYRWRISHTIINGKRLVFTGNGGSLLGHWILWELLTIITIGLYGFFVHVALRKWELERTYIDGEPIVAGSKPSYFDGNSFAYFGYGLLSTLLLVITCGLSYPWVMSILQKWDAKHQVINGRRLAFSGSGLGFLGEFLIILILSVITCGIYAPWGTVRLNKYIIRNTDFVE